MFVYFAKPSDGLNSSNADFNVILALITNTCKYNYLPNNQIQKQNKKNTSNKTLTVQKITWKPFECQTKHDTFSEINRMLQTTNNRKKNCDFLLSKIKINFIYRFSTTYTASKNTHSPWPFIAYSLFIAMLLFLR